MGVQSTSPDALTFVYGHIHPAQTLLLVAIHVICERVAGLLPGLDKGLVQGVIGSATRHVQWSVAASVAIGAQLVGLSFTEVGQAVVVIPAIGTLPLPAVVVFGVAADVHHGIERGRASPHAAPGPVKHTAVHACLGQRVVVPVVLLVAQVVRKSRRHVDLPGQPDAVEEHVLGPSF